jgi:hypothetical protein
MKVDYTQYHYQSEFILMRKFFGPIDIHDITDSWDYLLAHNILNDKHRGVINDIRDAELNMDIHNFQVLLAYLRKNTIFQEIKLAVICDTPGKIIFPMIGNSLHPELKIKPFSTLEAAAEWILS